MVTETTSPAGESMVRRDGDGLDDGHAAESEAVVLPFVGEALDLCGAVGPSYEPYQRRFAWRAAFDFYFPGVMPPLASGAGLEYEETRGAARRRSRRR